MEKGRTKKHMESVEISTLKDRISKRKPVRLAFTHYLVKRYGINMATAYVKMRRSLFHRWEVVGIKGCISMFLPEYTGECRDFYRNLGKMRPAFRTFMSEEMGMCKAVTDRRFTDFDFTELEVTGLAGAYDDFVLNLAEGEENP